MSETPEAILFDLDGTLIDTAPDMVAVLQAMQADHGVEPIDYDLGRSYVSNGSLGLVRLGFGELPEAREKALQQEYLDRYSGNLASHSGLFDGLNELLTTLESAAMKWGVVTNKPAFLTDPLMQALGLSERSSATVSGDTLTVRKPDPAPLLHACKLAGINPDACFYVGDALRDIDAGKRAGMQTIAAGWGYITADDHPTHWNADHIAWTTGELSQIVTKLFKL